MSDDPLDISDTENELHRIISSFKGTVQALAASGAKDFKSQLRIAGFSNANMHGHNWTGLNLNSEDLSGLNFSNCDLRSTTFNGAQVSEVDFTAALLDRGALDGAIGADSAKFQDQWQIDLRNDNLLHVHALSGEKRGLFVGCGKKLLRIWDHNGNEYSAPADTLYDVKGVAPLSNGGFIVWDGRNTIQIWTAHLTLAKVISIAGLIDVQATSDGLIVARYDDGVRCWDIDGKKVGTAKITGRSVERAAAFGQGRLMTVDADNRCVMWRNDIPKPMESVGRLDEIFGLPGGRIAACAFRGDSKRNARTHLIQTWNENGDDWRGHDLPGSIMGAIPLSNDMVLTWTSSALRWWNARARLVREVNIEPRPTNGSPHSRDAIACPLSGGRSVYWNGRDDTALVYSSGGKVLTTLHLEGRQRWKISTATDDTVIACSEKSVLVFPVAGERNSCRIAPLKDCSGALLVSPTRLMVWGRYPAWSTIYRLD